MEKRISDEKYCDEIEPSLYLKAVRAFCENKWGLPTNRLIRKYIEQLQAK